MTADEVMAARISFIAIGNGLSLDQMMGMKDQELLRLPNFGRTSLKWLRAQHPRPLRSYDDHTLLAEIAHRLLEGRRNGRQGG